MSGKNKFGQSQIRQGANPVITERPARDTDWPSTIDPLQLQNNLGVHWLSLAFCIHPLNWKRKEEKLMENERKRAAEAVRPMDLYSIHMILCLWFGHVHTARQANCQQDSITDHSGTDRRAWLKPAPSYIIPSWHSGIVNNQVSCSRCGTVPSHTVPLARSD